jgi:type IV secretory pathway VirB10-like protein
MQETKDLQKSAGILLPAISWVTFALGTTLLILLRRFGRIDLIKIIRVIFWISAACSFTVAWAVTYIVAALSTATAGNAQPSIIEGSAIVGLQWATFACGLLVAFLVHVVTTDPKEAAKPVKKPVKQQGTTDVPPKASQPSTAEPKQPAPKDTSASKPAAPKEAAAPK